MADKALQAQQDNIRLPVYDIEGFRTDWNRYDQTMINCFAEVVRNPTTGEGEVVSTKRSGIKRFGSLDFSYHMTSLASAENAYPIANIAIPHLYDVYVTAYYDTTYIRIIMYRPIANTSILLGSIATVNSYDKIHLSFGWVGDKRDPAGSDPLKTALLCTWEAGDGSSSKGYVCHESGGVFVVGTLSQITDANYPSNQTPARITSGPILQLNNQFYVATIDGSIFGTGSNVDPSVARVIASDITAPTLLGWTDALNFISSLFPERFHTLVHYKHHLVAFGKTSVQFFNDVGGTVNPGVALGLTDQAFIRFGAISSKHVINVDDILYWIAYGKDNTVGLWKLDGYTPVKVSTKKQDNEFATMMQSNLNRSYLFTLIIGNKKHIGVGGGLGAYTIIYGDATDTTDTQNLSIFDGAGRFAMYSLEDKTWWYLNNGGCSALFPVTSFGTPYGTGNTFTAYRQYILRNNGIFDATRSSNFLYYVLEGEYKDAFNNLNITTDDLSFVHSIVQLNSVQFQNEKRKRINKAKIIMSSNFPVTTTDTNIYSMYLSYSKKNVSDTLPEDIITRQIPLPQTTYRYYVNNLGMSRNICFCISEKTPYAMSIKALELDLAQGVA